MWAIIGLGNPGAKYALTRHNIGFMAVDAFARSLGGNISKSENKAFTLKLSADGEDILLIKPQTYMNHSGESVIPLLNYYKIEIPKVLVIHDEIDLPFGRMKIQKNRSPGGHNGLKSINEQLGHQDYARLKLGVGRPSNSHIPVADFVLQSFSNEEQQTLTEFLNLAGDAIESVIFNGIEMASNQFNRKSED